MAGAKPWQIGVIVVGLLVGVASAAYSLTRSSSVKLPHESVWVDVETGDLFEVDTSRRAMMPPALHPGTKRASLLRVDKDPSGKWFLTERHRSLLESLASGVKHDAVDPETGEIKVSSKAPTRYEFPN